MKSEGTESMKLLWRKSKMVCSKIHFDEIRGMEKHETVMAKKRKDGNHQKIKQIAKTENSFMLKK